ncbi:MAG: NAD-dependent epimerase/dehydratase family protein [Candidatus Omnitrophica bacterium]|nr:NAD-dependent epimerase/dehydratase family protein [Candidatus Omnitrophota bacterium]
MPVVIVTGSSGLIGSATVRFFAGKGFQVVGIDNDMRRYFFGDAASTADMTDELIGAIADFAHYGIDIRDLSTLESIFKRYGGRLQALVHTAAQPSHDWAASEPFTDFEVNAGGTLNLLELTRKYAPEAVFIFTSTNKVYGDRPNALPFAETATRWELPREHPYYDGIDEMMSIDQSTHSLFGVSKMAADILVQEYGRYFGMQTVCFRGGCLTGPQHTGVLQHGFLAYLMKCCVSGNEYTVFGYKGKQVRDNLHSHDLASAFWHFYQQPRSGEVYNIGGGRGNSCSVLEAIGLCEKIAGKKMKWQYSDKNRAGDHIWYISGLNKFKTHYPDWQMAYSLEKILIEIYQYHKDPAD